MDKGEAKSCARAMQQTRAVCHTLSPLETLEAALAGIGTNARQTNGDSTLVTGMIGILEVEP